MGYIIVALAIVVVIGIIILQKIEKTTSSSTYIPVETKMSSHEFLLLLEINNHRRKLGLQTLTSEQACKTLANTHTNYMEDRDETSHRDALKRKKHILSLGFQSYGEILGSGYKDIQSLFQAYLRSDSHRKIIESPDFRYVGVCYLSTYKTFNMVVFAGDHKQK